MEEYEYTEHWMQRIVDRLDRLIAIGESLEGQVRLPSELEVKTFADAKEPEHPAGPMPDPGEGYRILSKNPPEDLQEGDEFWFQAKWYRSAWSDAYIKDQEKNLWYRRKIEPPKPPQPEYREPVLPADAGKLCEFNDGGTTWEPLQLRGWAFVGDISNSKWISNGGACWKQCRIKKES